MLRAQPAAAGARLCIENLEPRLLLTGNAPDAANDYHEISQATETVLPVLANDFPAEPANTLRIASFEQPAQGTHGPNPESSSKP